MIPTTRSLTLLLLAASLSSAFPIYTFSPPNLSTRDSSSSLQQCLSSTGGELSYSSSSNYTTLSSSYNPLFDYKPYVVAVPSSAAEVSSIVRCVAAENGSQKLTPKSGGHSYTAYSLGGADGSVVVDLSQLNEVTVDSGSKTVSVGAGVRLGKLAQSIFDQGGFALPHGTCPYVGVGGHALGGGFGFPTRAWGFLLDRITEMDMVDVNGTVRTVSKDSGEDDLWWALRGAGSNNFGIVTRFTFSLLDAPTTTINYAYNYKTNSDCAKAIVALQNMTLATNVDEGLEKEFGGELLVAGEAGGDFDGNACQLSGQHINASQQHHSDLIDRFHSQAGIAPASSTVQPFSSWLDSLEDIMGSLDTSSPGQDHEQFYAKSLVQPSTATYNYTSALALVDQLNSIAGLHGTGNSISFDFLGPLSYPATQSGTASFNAHNAAFVYQFYSYGFPDNDNPDQQQDVWTAFDGLVDTAKNSDAAAEWGAYVNYVDARLSGWAQAYYGDGVERLKQIKGELDAMDVFWFPQGLGSA
ncbi:hypothetical protein PHSY_001975 [Pseudozyma hubeiensis SY62]|uniref:FAD-binding PCMH-type domain-containing protein n=1 Tax=Pseudozyma hubeiensis (strain SY62) TaxID=1305764 RepID=R9P018_PSEHS|nr:hypothetical protein PHSY_001975 [Pseudozyma hubeiensis SY62]GAC94404.1 hypothetical protein PHSY_001975 [Pseudozyma hubeiensis SY62]